MGGSAGGENAMCVSSRHDLGVGKGAAFPSSTALAASAMWTVPRASNRAAPPTIMLPSELLRKFVYWETGPARAPRERDATRTFDLSLDTLAHVGSIHLLECRHRSGNSGCVARLHTWNFSLPCSPRAPKLVSASASPSRVSVAAAKCLQDGYSNRFQSRNSATQ